MTPRELRTLIVSDEFEERVTRLFDRVDRGELISLPAAAKALGLPLPFFIELYFGWHRYEAISREAAHAVKH